MINTDIIKYDHGARRYRPALLGFSQPDALAESYPWLNPYLYCAANPVNLADRDGRRIFHEIDGKEYEYRNVDNTWGFYDEDGRYTKERDPVIGLAHELGHAYDYTTGFSFKKYSIQLNHNNLYRVEVVSTIIENTIRESMGVPLRIAYESNVNKPVKRTYLNYTQNDKAALLRFMSEY